MRQRPTVLSIWTAALAMAACNPSRFDDLAKKAPVQAAETPDDLAAFGSVAVAPSLETGDEAVVGMVVVAGQGSEALVSVHLLSDGTLDVSSGADLPGFGGQVTGLALAAPRSGPAGGPARPAILVGVPATRDTGGVYLATVDALGHLAALPDVPVPTPSSCGLNDPDGFGVKVGAGDLDGNDDEQDWVVLSRDRVCFFQNENPSQYRACHVPVCDSCQFAGAEYRSLLVGDLVGDQARDVAVGVPNDDTGGQVIVYSHAGWLTVCPDGSASLEMGETYRLPAPNHEGSFGWALAATPSAENNGQDALIVAAPESATLYVYDLPATGGATPMATFSYQKDTSGSFGQALLVTDLLGDTQPELVVGAPGSEMEGNEAAGQVYIFEGTGPGSWSPEPSVVLSDFESDRTHHFGKALTTVTRNDTKTLVVVSDEVVFTYPRKFLEELAETR